MTKSVKINEKGDTIPITINEENGIFKVDVDGVLWLETQNRTHAAVIYNMLCDHLIEYMQYERG